MAKIVIDIPEEWQEWIKQGCFGARVHNSLYVLAGAVMNGVVLPKDHGRLIGSPTMEDIEKTIGGKNDFADCIRESVKSVFDNAQTIVPADKEVEE